MAEIGGIDLSGVTGSGPGGRIVKADVEAARGRGGATAPAGRSNGGDRIFASPLRSEEHTSELQSLMRISYAVFCLKKKKKLNHIHTESFSNGSNIHIHNLDTQTHEP